LLKKRKPYPEILASLLAVVPPKALIIFGSITTSGNQEPQGILLRIQKVQALKILVICGTILKMLKLSKK
jgi:hypothetical protein